MASVETTGGLASEICGWWFAALGATVGAQVRNPHPPSRWEAALRRHMTLTSGAPPGVNEARIRASWNGANGEKTIHVDMTASQRGEELATDQAIWALSGMAALTFAADPASGVTVPCVPSNRQLPILSGTLGAFLALAGLVGRATGGVSFGHGTADLDEFLTLIQMQPLAAAQLPPPAAASRAAPTHAGGVFPARDGLVYARPLYPEHWGVLLERTGSLPELAARVPTEPWLLVAEQPRIDAALSAWVASQERGAVVAEFQARHVPLSEVNRPRDVLRDPMFVRSGVLRDGPDGLTVGLPWRTKTGSAGGPVVTPSPSGRAPLAGIRVLDLTWAWAGPFATTMLGDLGAEVLNVEWLPRPSNLRVQLPKAPGFTDSPNAGGWWSANQRGKLSIGINLKDPAGVELVRRLAEQSHLVMQNFAPGVVDRLGVGYGDLVKRNPALVYVSMSAFGPDLGSWTGYGPQVFTTAGGAFTMPGPRGEPSQMRIPYPDPVSGLVAAVAALAYLVPALHSGAGAYVEISEVVATCMILIDALSDAVDGAEIVPTYQVIQAEDGRPAIEVVRGGDRFPVATAGDVMSSARLADREFWLPDVTPELAAQHVRIPGSPFTVNGARIRTAAPAPSLFGDTEQMLRERLGLSRAEIAALQDRHAIPVCIP